MNTETRRSRGGSTQSKRRTFSNSSRYRGNSNRRNSSRKGGGGRKSASFNPSQFINTNPVDVKEEVYVPENTFGTFGLNNRITRTLAQMGIETPTPIQDKIIPEIMDGHDVIGLAETGTGKTAAFLVPILDKTLKDRTRQTLILTPTRELAIQIEAEFRKLASGTRLSSVTCVGGMNIRPQLRALSRMQHFIIGTPGRVLDLIDRRSIKPETLRTIVLDEADRMLDMGFINDIKKILASTPKDRETLFFSATMTDDAQKIVHDFLIDPVTISVKKKDVTNSIEQDVIGYNEDAKFGILLDLMKDPEYKRVMIFGAMKHSVEKLAKQLLRSDIKAESIHGNKNHTQRQRALTRFKQGEAQVLVATDVASRGIHVDDVTHVINYDMPATFEDYVHRIGRTGRGHKRGKALTFVPERSLQRNRY